MGRAGRRRAALVVAAQGGDDRALDGLVAGHLALVYSIVRRALAGHPAAVDDVVQDTMVRALRQLPSVREPESFRAWIAAIAVRQAATFLHGERVAAGRRAVLDDVAGAPDAGDFEDLTVLRLDLAAQRRQAGQAVAWLDPDDRLLWSLWWLEVGEELSRAELAAALGVSVAHAAVRVQRLRRRLEQARALVAALDARPRCPWLSTVVADWDGIPGPLWRKRIGRHTRSCATCAGAADDLVETERLLTGLALLPVPVTLAAALATHGLPTTASTAACAPVPPAAGAVAAPAPAGAPAAGTGAAPGMGAAPAAGTGALLGPGAGGSAAAAGPSTAAGAPAAAGWLAGVPIAKVAAAVTVLAGAVAAAVAWPGRTDTPPRPVNAPFPSVAAPSRTAPPESEPPGALRLGPVSLESGAVPGRYLGTTGQLGTLVTATGPATFEAVPGLSDAACFSFRSANGQYLRHQSWRLRLSRDEGSFVFRGDATFCATVTDAGEVFLESANYRGYFVHRQGDELWVDQADGSAAFRADSAFRVRPPLP
ncbi:sigma-70 family RNA polymerase sigma factor [Dactylosporangium sp. NPDC050588]|uniref:sigma-70 family RNA polymerase sigma factor n=1 Tax=Dactylosporangium sp. NPDC050588 TaxID=3157211 RepID=UPI0034083792